MNGCSKEYKAVTLTVKDFRFILDKIYLSSDRPSRLIIRNLARELYRFKSQVVSRSEVRIIGEEKKPIINEVDGVMIPPGKALELVFILKPRIYDFRCPIREHRGMKGMFVVKMAGRE